MPSAIPKAFYLDAKTFNPITQKIFDSSWSCFRQEEHSLKQNDCIPITHQNTPLLLSYTNNRLNLLSNVCTHRAHILIEKKTNNSCIRCPYHGRQFDLEGLCKSSPGFEKDELKDSNNNLLKLNQYRFLDLFFYSIKPSFQLKNTINEIKKIMNFIDHNDLIYEHSLSKTFVYDVNWALYCENYLEGLHIPFVHKGLAQHINIASYKTIVKKNFVLQQAEAHRNQDSFRNSNIGAYYFWIFPGMMLNYYPWGLSINVVMPLEVQQTKIQYFVYRFSNAVIQNNDAGVLNVENEDQRAIENVQRGLKSTLYNSPMFSNKYEKGVKKFHELILNYF